MTQLLLIHDKPEIYREFPGRLKDKDIRVEVCPTALKALERVRSGLGSIDVVMVHKDLGERESSWVNSDTIIEEVRRQNKAIRVGVISGEYPDGERHVIEGLKADFYCDPSSLNTRWVLEQIKKGLTTSSEREKRGVEVEMPPFEYYGIERRLL